MLLQAPGGELALTGGERWAGPSIVFDHLSQTVAELPGDAQRSTSSARWAAMTEDEAVRKLMALPVRLRAGPAAGVAR